MTFGEKLLKLRKEKGLSQEALAEKLNTTRQAVSKWENGQGYPETEKLLMIGNLFEVSMDYLLKETVQPHPNEEEARGYYVNKETAEAYLMHERRTSKFVALGFGLLIFSTVPYLVFKQEPAIYTFLIIVIAVLGIGMLVTAISIDGDNTYKALKKEPLLFDPGYLKELAARYEQAKRRCNPVIVVGVCLILTGGLAFLLEKKEITSGILVPYYPGFAAMIAVGMYIFVRTLAVLEAYKLLVKNEEHVNRLGAKLLKKARKKIEDL
ncbi:helix-turn-helix transcriptional regulator [Paenibacillus faecis]|uniref:Helix-turn-helix transcriptional regulator n=1 Tax=Paenibacillus faecis TaxID=862114 RepID=A0A5D0CS60_9BACL|nr:helix-turn-helix transcriptional regulator [Paenibacillus faecis]TYA12154.1 helix-turn-helix transcriptional regulator [Paenibacillus faecis]